MISSQFKIQGSLFDGETSNASDATLIVNQGGIIQLICDGKESLPVISKISSRLGNTARYIEIDNLGRFETFDNDAVDQLSKFIPSDTKSTLLHTLESNLALILIAIVITVCFAGATIKWGIPALADHIVEIMPEKANDLIEDVVIDNIEKRWFKPSTLDQEQQEDLHQKFNTVLKKLGSENKGYIFKLKDAKETIGANALAFPSGMIIMTDQLIELADNDQQLMGIMAHEIGHLERKHSLRQLVRGSIVTFLVAFISGDVSGASSALITAPVVLLELSYSREFETEADHYALQYFECDVEGLNSIAAFFNKINDAHRPSPSEKETTEQTEPQADINHSDQQHSNFNMDFLSTHPGSKNREKFFLEHAKTHCSA